MKIWFKDCTNAGKVSTALKEPLFLSIANWYALGKRLNKSLWEPPYFIDLPQGYQTHLGPQVGSELQGSSQTRSSAGHTGRRCSHHSSSRSSICKWFGRDSSKVKGTAIRAKWPCISQHAILPTNLPGLGGLAIQARSSLQAMGTYTWVAK